MEEYILHSAKGTGWANHKYISKYFKNGQWQYVYPNIKSGMNKLGTMFGSKSSNKPNLQSNYQKTNETVTITKKGSKDGKYHTIKTTEYTKNGQQWLSSKQTVTSGGGNKTVFKTKGKIEQGVENTARKGAKFISKIGSKAKKAKNKINQAITNYNDKHTYVNGKSMYEIKQQKKKK